MSDRVRINLSLKPHEARALQEMAARGRFGVSTLVATLCRRLLQHTGHLDTVTHDPTGGSDHLAAEIADEIQTMFDDLARYESTPKAKRYEQR